MHVCANTGRNVFVAWEGFKIVHLKTKRTLCANITRRNAATKITRLKSPGEVKAVRGKLGLFPLFLGTRMRTYSRVSTASAGPGRMDGPWMVLNRGLGRRFSGVHYRGINAVCRPAFCQNTACSANVGYLHKIHNYYVFLFVYIKGILGL